MSIQEASPYALPGGDFDAVPVAVRVPKTCTAGCFLQKYSSSELFTDLFRAIQYSATFSLSENISAAVFRS